MTRVLTSTGPMRKALVLSFAAHGAIFCVTRVTHPRELGLTPPSALLAPAEDRWTGTTAELPFAGSPGTSTFDVAVEAPPVPALAPVPVPAVPPVPPEPAAAAPVHHAAPVAVSPPASAEPPRPRRKPRPPPSSSGVASAGDAVGAAPGGPGGGAFGAEGAASVRDLGRAFTRAIPPACDTDPVWASLPTGETGKLEVAVHVDDTGHITGAEPRGSEPPKALVSLVRRTIPLLQAGTFAVRQGGVGEGTEILELRARISDAATGSEDDAPGASSRLAFEYGRGRGKAGFTQAGGRHVEVTVRVVKVEAGR